MKYARKKGKGELFVCLFFFVSNKFSPRLDFSIAIRYNNIISIYKLEKCVKIGAKGERHGK